MKKHLFLLGCLASLSSTALAISVDWAGTYRFEMTEIDKTFLDSGHGRKSYLLNHLSLSPKIVAADGINLVANFEVLGNPQYPDSQAGQQFGSGVNRGTANDMNGNSSNVYSQNQSASNLTVRELYLRVAQEYGEIVVGRAPIQFGTGMTYNAGRGAFDHWGDVHDLVAYRFLIGNLSVMPMIGKPYDFSPAQGRDVTDVMWDIEYNNAETESSFGILYRTRTSSQSSNDAANSLNSDVNPQYPAFPTASYVPYGAWSSNHTNVLLARGWEGFKFRMEAGFDSGSTGVKTSTDEEIKLNGYGVALELEFPRPESKFQWMLRTGMASGDNPTTANYEGYQFDRNYDLGFLLFNHPMGQFDVLTSNAQRHRSRVAGAGAGSIIANDEALDEDSVSNAIYVSPKFTYLMSDKLEWRNILTYAQSQSSPSRTGEVLSKDLGYEWDTALIYRPYERVQWVNEIGIFMPGSAYKGGSLNYTTGMNYGFQSKAAISF